ncbi:hypothetical protein OKW30_001410 [Paraburkholderia sp. Clong3]|uniref:gp53 minor capsid family protein n=1 Tax=Paraburkholderia sp. Clong3 TaxID=2991061 RepID=UPI003D257AE6
MSFPRQVNVQAAPAVLGDFCDSNPRATVNAGEAALIAGANGVTVGRFAWLDPVDRRRVNSYGAGEPSGFVRRDQQALITAFLAEYGLVMPVGSPITLFSAGGFWVRNDGDATSARDQPAYANNSTGQIRFDKNWAGASVTGQIDPNVVTGSIEGNTLTVTAVTSGVLSVGQTISGEGVADGTEIIGVDTDGTYAVSIAQSIDSTEITGSGGTLTVTDVDSGEIGVGDAITGASVADGTAVIGQLTGMGGAGTYAVNIGQTVASEAMETIGGTKTKWVAASAGAPDELVKMTTWLRG